MMRFITPIILIAIAITTFFVFTNPTYNTISALRAQAASYNEALNNSKALENQRDILTAKYNAIDPGDLIKLQKLLPSNIDNIRLILEIEQIASPYNMVLKDIKYNPTATAQTSSATTTPGGQAPVAVNAAPVPATVNPSAGHNYGAWDLEFSTNSTYNNFINFTKALESNLRIVDISSVDISPDSTPSGALSSTETYTYNFKITTYWLKN